jgi:hypothetical protein
MLKCFCALLDGACICSSIWVFVGRQETEEKEAETTVYY